MANTVSGTHHVAHLQVDHDLLAVAHAGGQHLEGFRGLAGLLEAAEVGEQRRAERRLARRALDARPRGPRAARFVEVALEGADAEELRFAERNGGFEHAGKSLQPVTLCHSGLQGHSPFPWKGVAGRPPRSEPPAADAALKRPARTRALLGGGEVDAHQRGSARGDAKNSDPGASSQPSSSMRGRQRARCPRRHRPSRTGHAAARRSGSPRPRPGCTRARAGRVEQPRDAFGVPAQQPCSRQWATRLLRAAPAW